MREHTAAFSRRQKTGAEAEDAPAGDERPAAEAAPTAGAAPPAAAPAAPAETTPAAASSPPPADPASAAPARASSEELPAIEPPEPKGPPWPDATPPALTPVRPAPAPVTATDPAPAPAAAPPAPAAAPPAERATPPAAASAAPAAAPGDVEDPTYMPAPREVPTAGNPDEPAPAPGRVPPGDSRSLRRGGEYALVYRVGTHVISRTGSVGTRGSWRVVEYPTSAAASHAYARECSRFVSEGFSDYRDRSV